MSVALSIYRILPDGSKVRAEYVPVAPQQVFDEDWLPVAESLGLEIISNFPNAFSYHEQSHVDDLMAELEQLEAYVRPSKPWLADRVAQIRQRLQTVKTPEYYITIG